VRADRDGGLSPEQARRVYDRIGRLQDIQFYERKPVREMIAAGRFGRATSVLDFGCGTGALAATLLERHLPATARYVGVDVSPRMVEIARRKVGRFGARAEIDLINGVMPLPFADGSFDRVVACYVLDLLTREAADALMHEAQRVIKDNGLLCLVSITSGCGLASRAVMRGWALVWSIRPELTGGCRPIEVCDYLPADRWQVVLHATVSSMAVASEVVIAQPAGS
jgi:ubiquinone/menaquinone biosynthesis C-methylase UbiE